MKPIQERIKELEKDPVRKKLLDEARVWLKEDMADLDKLWNQLFSLGKSFNQSINEIIKEKKAMGR